MEDLIGVFFGGIAIVTYLFVIALSIIGMWRVFEKAGRQGWECLIPIYSAYVLLKISGKPGWWLFLFLIPFVNIIMVILLYISLARSFGKDGGYAFGLLLLPFIFYPLLGLGEAEYVGPDGYVLLEEHRDEMV